MVNPGRIPRTGTLICDFALWWPPAILHTNLQITMRLEMTLRPLLLQHNLPRRPKDLEIHYHHHGKWDVEAAKCRVHLIVKVLTHNATFYCHCFVIHSLVHFVLVAEG